MHPECSFGDYYVRGYSKATVIEKKEGVDEIANNCSKSKARRRRFEEELTWLRENCEYPTLMLYATPSILLSPTLYTENPGLAVDSFLDLIYAYNIRLLCVPRPTTIRARRVAGTLAARVLLRGVFAHEGAMENAA